MRQALRASRHDASTATTACAQLDHATFSRDGLQQCQHLLSDEQLHQLESAVQAALTSASSDLATSTRLHECLTWPCGRNGIAISRNGNRWELTVPAAPQQHLEWMSELLGGDEYLVALLEQISAVMPPRAHLIRAGFVLALPTRPSHPCRVQDVHPDLNPAVKALEAGQSCTVLVPLTDVATDRGMGGTEVLMGSHRYAKSTTHLHELKQSFDADGACEAVLPADIRPPVATVTRRGCGYVLDSFVLHRGLANSSNVPKALLYLVCSTPGALDAALEADKQNDNAPTERAMLKRKLSETRNHDRYACTSAQVPSGARHVPVDVDHLV